MRQSAATIVRGAPICMADETGSIDISTIPELSRLVDEMQRTGRPCVLSRENVTVALLSPAKPVHRSRRSRAARDPLSVVERTAGIFHAAAKHPPATPAEEKAAFEQAVADEVMGYAED